jgi:hypothetical protein
MTLRVSFITGLSWPWFCVLVTDDKAGFLGADDPDDVANAAIPGTSFEDGRFNSGEVVMVESGIWEALVWRLACGVRSESAAGTEFLESEFIWLPEPRAMALGVVVLLNTEDGTVAVEELETTERGIEVGCDLAVPV